MTTVFIYALVDPVTDKIRYIGKTKSPTKRVADHLCTREKNHRGCWIRSLKERGLAPRFQILSEVPEDRWQMWERGYIEIYRQAGFDLVNETDGGDGVSSGTILSTETKRKMSLGQRGKVRSPETRELMRRSKMGANNPQFGRKHSDEHKLKIKQAMIKYWSAHSVTPNQREN